MTLFLLISLIILVNFIFPDKNKKPKLKYSYSKTIRLILTDIKRLIIKVIKRPRILLNTIMLSFDAVTLFIKVLAKNRTIKFTLLSILTLFLTLSAISLIVGDLVNKNSLFYNIFIMFQTFGLFVWVWILSSYISSQLPRGKNVGIHILLSLVFLIIFIFICLAVFEQLKNNGITNEANLWFVFAFVSYILYLFIILVRGIIERGNLLFSSVGGFFLFILFLFFITSVLGLYFTALDPENFPKDILKVIGYKSDDLISYILSYSYTGAEYFLQFPDPRDYKVSSDSKLINAIPFQMYLSYIFGMFIILVGFGFFVSYAVTIYVLKHSNTQSYNNLVNRKGFVDEYKKFLKVKTKYVRKRLFMKVKNIFID
ncbi:hypothetical protein N752_24510 [Desulforamulus aquiferis]|nr:hypothetical protein [Desulforamulus aquiferis]RYD02495.1 hypothetical protein N752_24510 [Desulforamulus aquiferis]